jgi:hypothetical protein
MSNLPKTRTEAIELFLVRHGMLNSVKPDVYQFSPFRTSYAASSFRDIPLPSVYERIQTVTNAELFQVMRDQVRWLDEQIPDWRDREKSEGFLWLLDENRDIFEVES